jgi:hypothetical protein
MSEEDEEDDPTADLYLHYHTQKAIQWLLNSWQAYRHRGILPYPGGFASQPRVWVRAIGILNGRYAPIFSRLLHEKYPKEGGREGDDLLEWVRSGGNNGSLFDQIGEHHRD